MSTIEKATGWVVELASGTLVGPFVSANLAAEYIEDESTRNKGSQETSAKIRPVWNQEYEYYEINTMQFDVDSEDDVDDEEDADDEVCQDLDSEDSEDEAEAPCHCDGCEERKRRKSECDCVA